MRTHLPLLNQKETQERELPTIFCFVLTELFCCVLTEHGSSSLPLSPCGALP